MIETSIPQEEEVADKESFKVASALVRSIGINDLSADDDVVLKYSFNPPEKSGDPDIGPLLCDDGEWWFAVDPWSDGYPDTLNRFPLGILPEIIFFFKKVACGPIAPYTEFQGSMNKRDIIIKPVEDKRSKGVLSVNVPVDMHIFNNGLPENKQLQTSTTPIQQVFSRSMIFERRKLLDGDIDQYVYHLDTPIKVLQRLLWNSGYLVYGFNENHALVLGRSLAVLDPNVPYPACVPMPTTGLTIHYNKLVT